MSDKAAFQASVHGIRTVGGRKCIQIILEAPIEQQAEIARICEHDAWVAVARIQKVEKKETNGKEKKRWNDLTATQQAGILCSDAEFQEYLGVTSEGEAVIEIHDRCCVQSRADLSKSPATARPWHDIVDNFRIWQQARA